MKPRILVLNGPNLNALGRREPEKYGQRSFADLEQEWKAWGETHDCVVSCQQSGFEGELLDILHRAEEEKSIDAAVFNPGAFTHTSRALRDCIASLSYPVIEVHITNTAKREEWRHLSTVSEVCLGTIAGFGDFGYLLALQAANRAVTDE